MTNTENTTTPTFELLDRAARFTSYDCPVGYRVSRCVNCPNAYTWKGAAARPACPACGGKLTTTTRMLKAVPFILLEGTLLAGAELMPKGLAAEAEWHEARAVDLVSRADAIDAKVADGRLVTDKKHPDYWSRRQASGSYGLVHKTSPAGLRENAVKNQAKAAKYRRRIIKLEAGR